MDILLQFLLIGLFIFFNGFFVMCEFSLVSSRKTRIEELVAKGSNRAKLVLNALNNLPLYISATQFGITIASLALGWIGEPALAHIFSVTLEPHVPTHLLFISSHIIALTISFILITFLQIIFGELAPKTTALQRPERFALIIVTPLVIFTAIFRPFIWLLQLSAQSFLKIFGIASGTRKTIYTEDEIKLILNQSAKSGVIDQHEVDIIERLFRIGDVPITRIVTAKADIIAFSQDCSIQEIAKDITQDTLHTRFPIFKKNIDHIVGYVAVTDLYILAKELKKEVLLKDTKLIRKTLYIPSTMRIDDVLVLLKKENVHLGIVINEKKELIGIVSIEDIIESLVGQWREG